MERRVKEMRCEDTVLTMIIFEMVVRIKVIS